ncbi:MAG: hypothetical protein ACRD25_08465 [Terracidiphilus sp.]
MDRFPKFPLGIAAAILLCASVAAQPPHRWSTIFQRIKHPKSTVRTEPPSPFPLGQEAPPASTDVQFRSRDRMSAADRALQADSEAAVAQHAGLANFQLDQGQWSYLQIDCRAFPNHLFLRFTRNGGPGDRSVFSVSILRSGQGRLLVIPVLRRGYSLFSPAPRNEAAIAAFNRIRREDGPNPKTGWLETALCYAALAGANPSVGTLTGDAVVDDPSPPLAEMQVLLDGGAIVRFTDQASHPHPLLWSLTFSPSGELLKVDRQPALIDTRWIAPQGWKPKNTTRLAPVRQPGTIGQPESKNSAPAKPISN